MTPLKDAWDGHFRFIQGSFCMDFSVEKIPDLVDHASIMKLPCIDNESMFRCSSVLCRMPSHSQEMVASTVQFHQHPH